MNTEEAVPADIEEYVKYVTKVPPKEDYKNLTPKELDKQKRIAARDAEIKAKTMARKFEKIQAIMDDENDIARCVFNEQSTRATTILAPFGLDLTNPSPGLLPKAGSLAYGYDTGSLYYSDDDLWYKLLIGSDIPPLVVGPFDNDENENGLYVAESGALRLTAASGTAPGGVSMLEQQFKGLKDFGLDGIRLKGAPTTLGVDTRFTYYAKWAGVMTFIGAFTTGIDAILTLERIGDTIYLNFPRVYNGTQAVGLITTTTLLPEEFRPDFVSGVAQIKTSMIYVINSSTGTSPNTVAIGTIQLSSTGFFQIGLGVNSLGVLSPFGGTGVSGDGNGILPTQVMFSARSAI